MQEWASWVDVGGGGGGGGHSNPMYSRSVVLRWCCSQSVRFLYLHGLGNWPSTVGNLQGPWCFRLFPRPSKNVSATRSSGGKRQTKVAHRPQRDHRLLTEEICISILPHPPPPTRPSFFHTALPRPHPTPPAATLPLLPRPRQKQNLSSPTFSHPSPRWELLRWRSDPGYPCGRGHPPHVLALTSFSLPRFSVFSLFSLALSARRQMLTVTAAALNGGCGRKGLRDCAAARTLNGKISGQNTPAGGCPAATTSGRIFLFFFSILPTDLWRSCVCVRVLIGRQYNSLVWGTHSNQKRFVSGVIITKLEVSFGSFVVISPESVETDFIDPVLPASLGRN